MIKFPLTELLDEQACYEWLLKSCIRRVCIVQVDTQYQQDKRHTIANVHQSSNTSVGNVGKCSIFLQGQTYQEAITPVVRSC